jgi:uncharacterized phage-associated protein
MTLFNFSKTLQATGYLLRRKAGSRDNYMRVLKLLYIAERRSLQRRGVPISGDSIFAMERGPVLSRTLSLIDGSDPETANWDFYVKREDYDISLVHEPGNMQLSRADINVLEEVADEFRGFDEWALVDWCHKNLPEYEKNWALRGDKKRHRISLGDLLEAVGRSADDEAAIKSQMYQDSYFGKLFGDHEPKSEVSK